MSDAALTAWQTALAMREWQQHAAPDLSAWSTRVPLQVGVAIVGRPQSHALNREWRGRDKPTNVLSFPTPAGMPLPPDEPASPGELVICAPIVVDEARAGGIASDAHWAHMMIHGILHLIGYDHINDSDAELMEATEIEAMTRLGLPNPYADH